MGIGIGVVKYAVFTPLTVIGFLSMYIFGGSIVTFVNTFYNIFAGNFLQAFLEYFLSQALPPTSIEKIISQTVIGTSVAAIKWFLAMRAMI